MPVFSRCAESFISDMIRLHPFLFLVLASVIGYVWTQDAQADDHLDIEYAEIQPLATESILLDVVRSGHRIVAVGERGHVVFSDDGQNWKQAEHVPTRSTLTSIISVGERLWAAGHDAVIITSADGGNTWSRQFFAPERQQAVMDLHFTDDDSGVATGSYGLYLVTADGGRTWADASVDPENDYHLNDIVRFTDGRQMIAGEAGYSYRSSDDGENWELMQLPYMGSMWGALIYSGDCVILYGLRGHAMESCDFGSNWFELDTGTEASLSAAVDHEGMQIFVGNNGTVLTRAGGGPVTVHSHSSGVDFAAVLPLGGGRFLLAGEDGIHMFPEHNGGGGDQ